MIIRIPIEGNRDWCCRSHISVDGWTRCVVVSRSMKEEQVMDLLEVPEDMRDRVELFFGDPSAQRTGRRNKTGINAVDRKEYNREYYRRKRGSKE